MSALDECWFWRSVRSGLVEALMLLDDEQLTFVPRHGLWSLGKVARHIVEAKGS
jgi:hypothetical protein